MFVENVYFACDIHYVALCTGNIRNANEISKSEMNESVRLQGDLWPILLIKYGDLIKYIWITTVCMDHALHIVLAKVISWIWNI